jgi:hypothetical protein
MKFFRTYNRQGTQTENTLPEGVALNPHSLDQRGIVQPDCMRNEAAERVLHA